MVDSHSMTVSKYPVHRMHGKQKRQGAVVAELAVCIPVLLLISISLIELTSLIFVRQALAAAAYEGAHEGVQPAATSADAVAAAQRILQERRIEGASVSVSPNIASVPVGEFFTVTVSAPSGPNSIAIVGAFNSSTLSSQATAMKETESN